MYFFFPKTTVLINFIVSLTIINDEPSLTIVNDDTSIKKNFKNYRFFKNYGFFKQSYKKLSQIVLIKLSFSIAIAIRFLKFKTSGSFLKTIVFSENETIIIENETKTINNPG